MKYVIMLDGMIEELDATFELAGDVLICTDTDGQEVGRYDTRLVVLYGEGETVRTVVDKLKAFKALEKSHARN